MYRGQCLVTQVYRVCRTVSAILDYLILTEGACCYSKLNSLYWQGRNKIALIHQY